MARARYDAVVVGAGPNGLAAAITLARAGRSVRVIEAASTVGGGARSEPLTLPGFTHDVCSAVHPLAAASPFFQSVPLAAYGVEWVHHVLPLAHPLDGGQAVELARSLDFTAEKLGADAAAYCRALAMLVREWPSMATDLLGPVGWPRRPWLMLRFAAAGLQSACRFAARAFAAEPARALFAGLAAHSVLPLERPLSAAFGLILGALGHVAGWPIARGGSQRIAEALAGYLRDLGGEIETGVTVRSLDELPSAPIVVCDVTPRQLARLAGARLPAWYRQRLEAYRYGPGVYKVDWALSEPIPWLAEPCRRAGTIHIGGTLEEIARSERAPWGGLTAERPFVLLAQPTLADPSRAPEGRHTAWAYCHVPHGSTADMLDPIERQIERFAPGFRDCVIGRHTLAPAALEARNANLVGGDIGGGALDVAQFIWRPTWRRYRTPVAGLYLCSASTPPGGGVHGMCGYHAARAALADQRHRVIGLIGVSG
jgi:phytoene dehydrogenase-like protein